MIHKVMPANIPHIGSIIRLACAKATHSHRKRHHEASPKAFYAPRRRSRKAGPSAWDPSGRQIFEGPEAWPPPRVGTFSRFEAATRAAPSENAPRTAAGRSALQRAPDRFHR
jgi:hypothetical protein